MKTQPAGSFRFAFTAGACLLLLPLKLVEGWSTAPTITLVSSWVADTCFLFLLCALSIWVGGSRPVGRRIVGGVVFVGLALPALAVIAAHTWFLTEAVGNQYALLDTAPSAVRYFLVEVVPRRVLWAAGATLLTLIVGAMLVARRVSAPPAKPALLTLTALSIAVMVHLVWSPYYPSVLWEVGVDLVEVISHPPITGARDSKEVATAGEGRRAVWPDHSRFDKVVVFVMESVPLKTLAESMAELPGDHFFNRERAHTHAYLDYFATNMDSRTGMLAMLLSRIVPFEAYTDAGEASYDFLRNEHSLVDDMAARGFTTSVVASQIDTELVAFQLPSWHDKLLLSDQEYAHPGGFLCVFPYQFDQACEDKILLPRIFRELDSNKRLFLFQEALYGHDDVYEDKIGKTPVQYYGEHLQAIQDHLAARGELDRTLIVVTSDHGPRWNDEHVRRSAYHLPLLLINPSFAHEDRPGLYNQSDFAALLATEMAGLPPPPPRTASLFVGPTYTSILGSVTAAGDLLVVKDRGWTSYVLADGYCPADGVPAGKPRHPLSPAALLQEFRHLRDAFHPGMGPPNPAVDMPLRP